jgi:8-oxo-dGTP pyrophosphatase MutT (NUDIX family)
MSFAEKVDILGMQFSNMWYRIWLNNPEKHFNIKDVYTAANTHINEPEQKTSAEIYKLYYQKKNKFEKNFAHDMGKKLRNLIQDSSDAEILWEIPKGGKKPSETNIDSAIREFGEETSIDGAKYRVLYNIPPIVESFVDNNTIYKNIYYIATPRKDIEFLPKINFKNFHQISEVEQIKWASLAEIRFMNLPEKTHKKLIRLYSEIIGEFKKASKKVASTPL